MSHFLHIGETVVVCLHHEKQEVCDKKSLHFENKHTSNVDLQNV